MKFGNLFSIYLTFLFCGTANAQNFNRPIPPDFPAYEYQSYSDSLDGYFTLTNFYLTNTPPPAQPAMTGIIDGEGYLVWYLESQSLNYSNLFYWPGIDLYSFYQIVNITDNFVTVMNTDFEIIDTLTCQGLNHVDSHDFQFEDDGSYWITGYSETVVDLSSYTFNGSPGSSNAAIRGAEIQHFDAQGNLIFLWNSNDHIHPTEAYDAYGYNGFGVFDYAHFNSIDIDHDGHLLISLRHLNAVYKVNSQTGEIIWRLGGKSSSFSFANNDFFSGQHHARRLPNGNISVFDNGNMHLPLPRSRAVEYALDTVNWTATNVWEFSHDPPVFARALGSYQRREDNIACLNYAWIFRPVPSILLLDDQDALLAEIIYQDSVMSYRAFYQDIPYIPARPEIECLKNDETITLTGPSGHTDYQWSNGETTTSINIPEPGTYMLWVNQGNGMIGSEPFVVESILDACTTTTISHPNPDKDKNVILIIDLLGRETKEIIPGQIYIYFYDNGESELRSFFDH